MKHRSISREQIEERIRYVWSIREVFISFLVLEVVRTDYLPMVMKELVESISNMKSI